MSDLFQRKFIVLEILLNCLRYKKEQQE